MNANSSLRVLLIGATGYIGSSVAHALDAAAHRHTTHPYRP